MTLNDLEQDLYRRLGFNTSSPDSATQTRLRAFINETQQEILSEPGMESLLNDIITFASVASTPEYSLPPAIARVKTLRETTNDRILWPLSLDEYRLRYPDPTQTTGTPERYVELGLAAVASQPSDASTLLVDSTAAGDTNTAFIEGYRTGGYFRSVSVTMTGVTAVNISATTSDWIQITKFYLSAAAVGTVTLVEDAEGGTVLATIPIGQTHARYRRIALVPTPSAAVTYTLDFERDAQSMANANDEPLLPVRFHRLLSVGARMREYDKQDDRTRYQGAQAEFLYGVRKLKFYLYSQAVGNPNLRGPQLRQPSTLGGQYPAGS